MTAPFVTVNKIAETPTPSLAPQAILIIGQKVAGGSATAGNLYSSIGNDREEDALFGSNSMVAGMVRKAKKFNKETRIDVIPLDDAGGSTAATGTVAFTGTNATADATITVKIGSGTDYAFTLDVLSGDNPTAIGDALEAAVLANARIPFTAVNTTGSVALTADNKGTVYNDSLIKVEGNIPGITITLTAFSGGATDPSTTGIFSAIGDQQYQTIIFPSEYGFTFVEDLLESRFDINNQSTWGVGWTGITDTFANAQTTLNTLNSKVLSPYWNESIDDSDHKGGVREEFDFMLALEQATIRALRLTDGTNVSPYVTANNPGDAIGGIHQASKPLHNTPIEVPIVDAGNKLTESEIKAIEDAGGWVIVNNDSNTGSVSRGVTTTYKTNTAGDPDPTWKYVNQVDTASVASEYIFRKLKLYRQTRLTGGNIISNIDMVNSTQLKASIVAAYLELGALGITQVSDVLGAEFKKSITITTDIKEGKFVVTMKLPIVGQLRIINTTIVF
jgi:phage tail sheath gpL-like